MGDFTIRDLQERCPNIGIDLLRRILREERNAGRLECLGRGPNAHWRNRCPLKKIAKGLGLPLTYDVLWSAGRPESAGVVGWGRDKLSI